MTMMMMMIRNVSICSSIFNKTRVRNIAGFCQATVNRMTQFRISFACVHIHKYHDICLMLIVRSRVTLVTSAGGAAVCRHLNEFTNDNIVTKYFNAECRAVAWSTEFQHISRMDLFVELYIYVIENNLMHYLSSVYFVISPLHVSGIFVAHHQEIYCI
jgi:hypothetical protein